MTAKPQRNNDREQPQKATEVYISFGKKTTVKTKSKLSDRFPATDEHINNINSI